MESNGLGEKQVIGLYIFKFSYLSWLYGLIERKYIFIFICLALKIHISSTTAELLQTENCYRIVERGELEVKVLD